MLLKLRERGIEIESVCVRVHVCSGGGRRVVLLSSPVESQIENLSVAREKVQSVQVFVSFEYSRILESVTYYYFL